MLHVRTPLFALAMLALAMPAARAADDTKLEAGILTCNIGPSDGGLVTSSRVLICAFDPGGDETLPEEAYTGQIERWGIELGETDRGTMKWAVLAPTNVRVVQGALAGTYRGISGEATVGVGVGSNILIGGSNDSISLQPISVQTQEGANLALGVAKMTLAAR